MPDIAGLKLIVPSSVSAGTGTATVSASGKVTYTSANTISINGCFTSTYDNYVAVFRHVANTSTRIDARMRAAGSDNSTSNSYVSQLLDANNTTLTGLRSTDNLFYILGNAYTTLRDGMHWYFYGPNLAQPTAVRSVNVFSNQGGYIADTAGTHNQSTAYDGFTFFTQNTQTLTGALCVYGLSQ